MNVVEYSHTEKHRKKGVICIVYITGDTHGEQSRFINVYEECKWTEGDTVIVCGDFGFLFHDNFYERKCLDELECLPYTICFVDGNHENFPSIFAYPEEEWNGGKIHRIRKNIIHLMRGQVFVIEGHKFFTMGGAYSVDSYMRKLNVSYWKEELPTDKEYKEATRNLKQHDNCVDYILTHTCPHEIIRMMGHTPNKQDLELTGFLEYVMYETNFKHWYFGHWHMEKEITPKFTVLWFQTIAIPPK